MGVYTNLSQNEIDFIEQNYKIQIKNIKNINSGILNSNFFIETTNEKFILRIYEADRTIQEEEQELIFLEKIKKFIPVALAIKNINQDYISIFNNKKISLFEYIDGESLKEINSNSIRRIGTYLAKLHSFSKNISAKDYNRKSRIDFDFYYNKIKEANLDFEFKDEIFSLADEISKIDFSSLPSGIIHGDIFPDNIILDEKKNIKAIIDFNESHYSAFIFDIAIIINFWIKIKNFDSFNENNFIREFLNYYSKERKIEKEELKFLDFALKKTALNFIFLRLYKEKIENSYQKAISIDEKSYLDLIKILK